MKRTVKQRGVDLPIDPEQFKQACIAQLELQIAALEQGGELGKALMGAMYDTLLSRMHADLKAMKAMQEEQKKEE